MRGFTIIEVMIVLAIVGLLLTVILLAVPALQRNSRNFQRKNFAERAAAQLETYYLEHNRKYPATPQQYCDFILNYLANSNSSSACNPSSYGPAPDFCISGTVDGFDVCYHKNDQAAHDVKNEDRLSIIYAHWCLTPGMTGYDIQPGDVIYSTDPSDKDIRKYAVWIKLEASDTIVCIDNDKSGGI